MLVTQVVVFPAGTPSVLFVQVNAVVAAQGDGEDKAAQLEVAGARSVHLSPTKSVSKYGEDVLGLVFHSYTGAGSVRDAPEVAFAHPFTKAALESSVPITKSN